jgi:hypothetical protein
MTEIGEVGVRKRRNRQEIKRLVREFETSGLRRSEFCQKHNLALGTLQRGLEKRRMEVDGQSESKRLVEVKMAGIQRNGSGPGTCSLEVVLAEGRRIEVRRSAVQWQDGYGQGLNRTFFFKEELRRAGHPERRQSSRPLRHWRIRLGEKLRDRLRSENARSQLTIGVYGVSSLVPFT